MVTHASPSPSWFRRPHHNDYLRVPSVPLMASAQYRSQPPRSEIRARNSLIVLQTPRCFPHRRLPTTVYIPSPIRTVQQSQSLALYTRDGLLTLL
jgi:hypothetical protein